MHLVLQLDDDAFLDHTGLSRPAASKLMDKAPKYGVTKEQFLASCIAFHKSPTDFTTFRRPMPQKLPQLWSSLYDIFEDASRNEAIFRKRNKIVGKIAEVDFLHIGSITIMVVLGPKYRVYYAEAFDKRVLSSEAEMFRASRFFREIAHSLPIFKYTFRNREFKIPAYVTMDNGAACQEMLDHPRVICRPIFIHEVDNKYSTTHFQRIIGSHAGFNSFIECFWCHIGHKVMATGKLQIDEIPMACFFVSLAMSHSEDEEDDHEEEMLHWMYPSPANRSNARQELYNVLRHLEVHNLKLLSYNGGATYVAGAVISKGFKGFLEDDDDDSILEAQLNDIPSVTMV